MLGVRRMLDGNWRSNQAGALRSSDVFKRTLIICCSTRYGHPASAPSIKAVSLIRHQACQYIVEHGIPAY